MNNPLSDIVSNQYKKWVYPEPILDLDHWLKDNWQWFDPIHAHRIFWPNQDYRAGLDLLVAGCGANQAAVFAYTNPQAKVIAIDVSQSSLDHHHYLKEKYGLSNLELYLLPVEKVDQLNRQFDLIVSTGVLHHLADPKIGLEALSRCLRQDGVIALMLYAKYGRAGVEILQSIARDLGFNQDEDSLALVKEMLQVLPQNHPVNSYIPIAPDLQYDAGLVDTFLHGRDKSFSVADCIDLVASTGLVFQDLFLKSPYYPPANSSNSFYSEVLTLPDEKQWSIMERINIENACHFFTVCRKERQPETYRIDFSYPKFLEYTPKLRFRCLLKGDHLYRYNWSTQLSPIETRLIERVDGHSNIKKILLDLSLLDNFKNTEGLDLEKIALTIFQSLWRLDFLVIGLESSHNELI